VGIQNCNLTCLPENYTFKYYYYHYLSWPSLIYVAEDIAARRIVGYVLAKIDDEDESDDKVLKGHITSLSVLREFRRLGVARKLMEATHKAMEEEYKLKFVTLHVRVSNVAALGLYKDRLKYEQVTMDKGYYLDGEDAYLMRKTLPTRAAD
jgi:peptide alpha-N-acetyltransferase